MKRSGDDDDESSRIKRPSTPMRHNPSGQTLGKTAAASSSGHKVTAAASSSGQVSDDALSYYESVRIIFENEREKYQEFLDFMNDFKAQRLDTPEVVERVNELFGDHTALLEGFKIFLPKEYQVVSLDESTQEEESVSIDEESTHKKTPFRIEEAFNLVNEVKSRFKDDDDDVFGSFIDILISYRKGQITSIEAYEEAASLFEGHDDLLDDYVQFFSGSDSPRHPPSGSEEAKESDQDNPSGSEEAEASDHDTPSGSEGQESAQHPPSGSDERESVQHIPSGREGGHESVQQTPPGSEGKGGGEI